MSDATFKLCKDCKWMEFNKWNEPYCMWVNQDAEVILDPLDGTPLPEYPISLPIMNCRYFGNSCCGKDAIWFEPKETQS
jgi:hypothetical protein